MSDEIQHRGNRNSGRYKRGSKNNALREGGGSSSARILAKDKIHDAASTIKSAKGGASNYKAHKKFEKEVQKTRLKNEKFLRNGYKKLSKMTPKQADLFLRKAKRLQKGDELADARLKAIRDEKIANINLNKSKIEGIDAVMKITKSTLSLADKLKGGGQQQGNGQQGKGGKTPPKQGNGQQGNGQQGKGGKTPPKQPDYYKDIADGAVALSKATAAIKKHQIETARQLGTDVKKEMAPTTKDVERYIRLTRASEKEARKRLRNIGALSTSGKGIVADGVKLLTKYEKMKDGG